MPDFLHFIPKIINFIENLLNSNFSTAIFGAFCGAYGAHFISERGKLREQLLNELHSTNSAIIIAFGICNSFLSLKKQIIKPLTDDFFKTKQNITSHFNDYKEGKIQKEETHAIINLHSIQYEIPSINYIKKISYEKISASAKIIHLIETIDQNSSSLAISIKKRNDIIDLSKTEKIYQQDIINRYFGIPYTNGHVNNDYPSIMESIRDQTDDCIKFSELLCLSLIEKGNFYHKKFTKKFKNGAPKIHTVDFSEAKRSGLIPNDDEYKDWINFPQH